MPIEFGGSARVGGGRFLKVPGLLLAGRSRAMLAYIRDIRTAWGLGRNIRKLLALHDMLMTLVSTVPTRSGASRNAAGGAPIMKRLL